MNIIISAPEFSQLADAIRDLASAMRTLSASGNCMSELVEAGVAASANREVAVAAQLPVQQVAPAPVQPPQLPQATYQAPAPAVPAQSAYPAQTYAQPQPPISYPTQQPQSVPVAPPPAQPVPAVPSADPIGMVPTTAAQYSMEQLAVAATQLVDAGRRGELVNLLASFGVESLTALPKEQYGNFATHLRSMGAKI